MSKENYDFPDKDGRFGEFGGKYVSETLISALDELECTYEEVKKDKSFLAEVKNDLETFVGRPSPLYFAQRWTENLGGAKIYLKREDLNHTGAHKINNTVGQVLLAKKMGKKRIIAETGAGQHGVATAAVAARHGLECIIFMGEEDIERQSPNVYRMKLLGANVCTVNSGTKTLKDAMNEAMRDWVTNVDDTHYIIGSVVGPHPYPDMVARFQSVISEELLVQLNKVEGKEYPDFIIACVGGGSNAAGIFYHYLDNSKVKLVGVEAAGLGVSTNKSAATTKLGKKGVLHGSKTLLMQDENGQVTEPYSISAGLDYPGIGPLHAHLSDSNRGIYISVEDDEAMNAGIELSRLEGIIPAIETAHAFSVFDKIDMKNKVVVINLSGRGDKDLETYIKWGKY